MYRCVSDSVRAQHRKRIRFDKHDLTGVVRTLLVSTRLPLDLSDVHASAISRQSSHHIPGFARRPLNNPLLISSFVGL